MAKLDRLSKPYGASDSGFSVNMNMDVNERNRVLPSLGSEHVQLFISMLPLKLTVRETDSFWSFSTQVYGQIQNLLKRTKQYQEVLARLDRNGEEYWKSDANFSAMGKYPFARQVGPLTLQRIHTTGTIWCPFFGRFIFLSRSVSEMTYDLVYEHDDFETANRLMNLWMGLSENAGQLDSQYTFGDFLRGAGNS